MTFLSISPGRIYLFITSINGLNLFFPELTYLRLERLDISGNRISSLPVELRSMVSLVYLNLNHNPLTSPPAKVCKNALSCEM